MLCEFLFLFIPIEEMYEEKKFVTVRTRERVEYMMNRRKIYIVVVHLIIRKKKIHRILFSLFQ